MFGRLTATLLAYLAITCLLFLSGCQSTGQQLSQTAFSKADAKNGLIVLASSYKTNSVMLGLPRLRSYELAFSPYDRNKRDLVRDNTGRGKVVHAHQTRGILGYGKDLEKPFYHVIELKPGAYVFLHVSARWFGNKNVSTCFSDSTFVFDVKPGEAVYIGDFEFFSEKYASVARLKARLNNLRQAKKALQAYKGVKRTLAVRRSQRARYKRSGKGIFGHRNCFGRPEGFKPTG